MIQDIEQMINKIALNAQEGHENPLKAFITLKSLKDYVDDTIKAIEPEALDEAQKYDGQELMGNIVRYNEGNTRWDYKHSEQYNTANNKVKEIRNLMKQAAKSNVDIVDEDGVVIEPAIEKKTKAFIKLERPKK